MVDRLTVISPPGSPTDLLFKLLKPPHEANRLARLFVWEYDHFGPKIDKNGFVMFCLYSPLPLNPIKWILSNGSCKNCQQRSLANSIPTSSNNSFAAAEAKTQRNSPRMEDVESAICDGPHRKSVIHGSMGLITTWQTNSYKWQVTSSK